MYASRCNLTYRGSIGNCSSKSVSLEGNLLITSNLRSHPAPQTERQTFSSSTQTVNT